MCDVAVLSMGQREGVGVLEEGQLTAEGLPQVDEADEGVGGGALSRSEPCADLDGVTGITSSPCRLCVGVEGGASETIALGLMWDPARCPQRAHTS